MKILFVSQDRVGDYIKECQESKHIHQVAFSTFHNALTQICFDCELVRTSINREDIK